MNMAYYVQLSPDANGLFGSGVTKTSIINSLKSNGVSDPKDFAKLDLAVGSNRVLFDSRYTLLLGTDKTSRAQIGTDLMKFFGDAVDEIHLRVPRLNEWLACVTFVDPDAANAEPTFQVVACVGSSQVANVPWTQEDKPPQIWKTHVWYEKPTGYKMIRDVKNFGAFGRWW